MPTIHPPAIQIAGLHKSFEDAAAIKLPRAQTAERQTPKALSGAQYGELVRAAQVAVVDEPLPGARGLAIVLGNAGLAVKSSPASSGATSGAGAWMAAKA